MCFVKCKNCKSEQTTPSMHKGWSVWFCENCHSYLNADGEVLSDEYFEEFKE